MRSLCVFALAFFVTGAAACGGDDDATTPAGGAGAGGSNGLGGVAGATGLAGAGGTTTGGGGTTGGSATTTGGASGSGTAGGGGTTSAGSSGSAGSAGASGSGSQGPASPFRYGINFGHLNASWGDAEDATLAAKAGARSARLKLPETHLTTWGYEIEVGDMKSYAALGLHDHVAFLSTPTREHSTLPAGEPDWKLEWYKPSKLYEPITLPNGEINPDNPWAIYVYKTVSTYKDWVHVWQVWNEPDWTGDWNVTLTWDTQSPQAKDLPRWNGSIFEYVRLLRVTTEAAKKADPNAKIALGGVGYPSFLGALLRVTDEPNGGAVTADYPKKGGDYFDVLDFHYYPVFSPGSSDVGVDGFLSLRDKMASELTKAGVDGKSWNVTETGAPSEAVGKAPGGVAYARNYLTKVMVQAQAKGIGGVDWFLLANTAASDDSFARMGLYEPISGLASTNDAKRTPTGTAYATLSKTLSDAHFDAAATAALGTPAAGVAAYAFVGSSGQRTVVAWARTGTTEEAQGSVSFPATGPVQRVEWDGATSTLTPSGGTLTAPVTGSPSFFVGP
jgi:hypothetical protein